MALVSSGWLDLQVLPWNRLHLQVQGDSLVPGHHSPGLSRDSFVAPPHRETPKRATVQTQTLTLYLCPAGTSPGWGSASFLSRVCDSHSHCCAKLCFLLLCDTECPIRPHTCHCTNDVSLGLVGLWCLAISNKAAVNILIQIFCGHLHSLSLAVFLEKTLLGQSTCKA